MTDKRAKLKGRKSGGRFMAAPHSLKEHQNFIDLCKDAKLIFFFLMFQFNGKNNGDLQATLKTVKAAGFGSSSSQLSKALKQLEDKGFVIKTRQGGKNQCNLYAVTCKPINDCNGKHGFRTTNVPSNEWRKIKS